MKKEMGIEDREEEKEKKMEKQMGKEDREAEEEQKRDIREGGNKGRTICGGGGF